MTTTALTCPTFCVSPHNEPDGVEAVHYDQAIYIPRVDGDTRVDVQQMHSDSTAIIYIDDRAYTADQADALIDAVASRVHALRQQVTR